MDYGLLLVRFHNQPMALLRNWNALLFSCVIWDCLASLLDFHGCDSTHYALFNKDPVELMACIG